MATFSINTLGCKVNQYESQQVRELLEQLGLRPAEPAEKADLVVVNTCCVTKTASAKSRQCVRKAQRLNRDAAIVVCGCLPTVQIGELGAVAKNVRLAPNLDDLAAQLHNIAGDKTGRCESRDYQSYHNSTIRPENGPEIKRKNEPVTPPDPPSTHPPGMPGTNRIISPWVDPSGLPTLNSFKGHTRAFLKVQDGCDGYCSYCIVPKTRPIVRSKPVETVLAEAQALVGAGHREIVVTGIFLGAYGLSSVRRRNWPSPQNDNLPNLLDKLAEISGLARIRLSSLEPADVTPRLLDTFCKHRNIMPHLHLSLQSGSDAILKKMCRQYSADEFLQRVELIKSRLDRPAITTDIIVGFPGETGADFEQTIELAREVGFAKMHVFTFSPRKGTAAAKMQPIVNTGLIKERSRILHELNMELGKRFSGQFVGESAQILLENGNGELCGRSERYFMVHLDKTHKRLHKNDLLTVRLIQNSENGVIGQV